MPLDPDIAAVIDALNAGFPRVTTMTGSELRELIRGRRQQPGEPEPVDSVVDKTVAGPAGDIPVRIYTPIITIPWNSIAS